MLRYENPRAFFRSPISPGEEQILTLPVRAPDQPGSCHFELDVVWEGNFWFKDRGSPTAFVELSVIG